MRTHGRLLALLPLLALAAAGCDRLFPPAPDRSLPDVAVVDSIYRANGVTAALSYNGNVVELRLAQPMSQLARGGSLWARVGPYIYLLSPGTKEVLTRYIGVAAVRVIVNTGDTEVARAMLVSDALNEDRWRRALYLLDQALAHGTARPQAMDALARFGEDNTTHEYNARFVPNRQ